jgi:hypothetical protein
MTTVTSSSGGGEGPMRRGAPRDDRVASFSTRAFDSGDPEDIAVGPRSLFVIDGVDTQVYRLRAGSNGRFDGAPPEGDDHVSSFDTARVGLSDPEGGAYDPVTRDLYLISRTDHIIVRVTVQGDLVESFDISESSILRPSDVALTPPRDGGSRRRAYVTDRGRDNDIDPNENDGRIFKFVLG